MTTQKMTPLKKATLVATLIATIGGVSYSTYAWAQTYHSQFAQKDQVTRQFAQTNVSILQISIRDYVAQLFVINFRIGEGVATSLDLAKKAEIEPQLEELRRQVAAILANS